MRRISIEPVTRVEGHLKVEVEVSDGRVVRAESSGLLFRGVELVLRGRDPRDAPVITQRVCGVCPQSHGIAACLALEAAAGMREAVPRNGELIRGMVMAVQHAADHILHFYVLGGLDYFSPVPHAVGLFGPTTEDRRLVDQELDRMRRHYVEALETWRLGQEVISLAVGRSPHSTGLLPGGVPLVPREDDILAWRFRIARMRDFIQRCYLPDAQLLCRRYPEYLQMGSAHGDFLAYGAGVICDSAPLYAGFLPSEGELHPLALERISEGVSRSWYRETEEDGEAVPSRLEPMESKAEGYSWIKAPRYQGRAAEVGPLAQLFVGSQAGQEEFWSQVADLLAGAGADLEGLSSTMGRNLARAIMAWLMIQWAMQCADSVAPGEPASVAFEVPREGEGIGLTEAPRGALLHWVVIRNAKIASYRIISPTTWNASPRDHAGLPGPMERAVVGLPVADDEDLTAVLRTVRSFDPCLACAVHLVELKKVGGETR